MTWSYTLKELALVANAGVPARSVTFSSVSTDTRRLEHGDVFFALKGENFDGNRFVEDAFEKGACAAVTSEPTPAGPCIVVADPLKALQSFAAHHRNHYDIPVIALTGSCGKTMAKELIAAVLSTRYDVARTPGNHNNDIGCPLSLLEIDGDTGAAVIEMGANHEGEIAYLCELARPTEAAITMIGQAHLEGFGTIDRVASAKGEIVKGLPPDGTFYVNADDSWCVRIAEAHGGPKIRFGRAGDVALRECNIEPDGTMRLDVHPVGELSLPLVSRAHISNVLLAIAVGVQHRVEQFEEPLRAGIVSGSRIRIGRIGPLKVIDDTYNANPASTRAALDVLADRAPSGKRIAVLGEMLELGEQSAQLHREIGKYAAERDVTHLFVRGAHADDVVEGAKASGIGHAEVVDDHSKMARAIWDVAYSGDTVLVKGSRGEAMEHVLDELRKLLGRA